jgi:O-acetylserine/cysteine efflux transporter
MPPFALCAWRFLLAAVPLVFFVPRPNVPWRLLLGYGFVIGVAQFGLLFVAIAIGMPAGLSSVIIQCQVFFTIGLSVWLMDERARPAQLFGAIVAASGLAIIGWTKVQGGLTLAFLLVVGAALAWAIGNVIAKKAGKVDLLGFIAWSSLAAPLPLALLSLAFEGPGALIEPLMHPTWTVWGSLLFIAYAATVFGFGTWSRLLARHDAAAVSPFALLIPVWGMASTALVFGERLTTSQAIGSVLVIAGLVLTVLGPGLYRSLRNRMNRTS